MSSQIHPNYSAEVEAAVIRLASLHREASGTYLSLGFYCHREDVALQGVGRKGSECLLKLQTQRGGRVLFQDVRKPPKVSGQNSGRHGSRPGLGEEPEPGPSGAACPGFYREDPQLCDFLQNHFRGEQVKLIKKMGDT